MALIASHVPPLLPLAVDLETKRVLKKLATAHRALAELKGAAGLVPNEAILINTLSLQEAKDSSAIENIITTHDDLYRSDDAADRFASVTAKEVYAYARAMRDGFQTVRRTGLITINDILAMQATLERNQAGFRRLPGTALKNDKTGEVVFTPPQSYDEIAPLMANLERFINGEDTLDLDPLVRMAVIHHQFETIHPFYDGNGRTGRILKEDLLGTPVLYLSRYINQRKADYYRLLQAVRTDGVWEEWLIYMLDAVEQMAGQTTRLVHRIWDLMLDHKVRLRRELPRIYSQDLLNNMFSHPYSKIAFVERDLGVSRITATRYLDELTRIGLMRKHKIGRESYYMNRALLDLLGNVQTV
ncbi:MAG: Fic family protein [Phenylobacterium sp.]|uniref:Fic family protein n=1 Tax=Phenylobacterium sp. TaxID=1871053 RepID=UPI00120E245F|nr:Fic family protein [Phenylobacterium sp.]TAL36097.1 MAG: Fic family protein [Phenylobacterium sp.]